MSVSMDATRSGFEPNTSCSEVSQGSCDSEAHLKHLMSMDGALSRIAAHSMPVSGVKQCSLSQAFGQILAKPVATTCALPVFDNAAMDGYGVRLSDLVGEGPWSFNAGPRIAAGEGTEAVVPQGCAAQIFTGAPIPEGVDAVIMQEAVELDGHTVIITQRPKPGQNIRRAGSDMPAGQEVLAAGQIMGPAEIAVAAAVGAGTVWLRRKVQVAVIVTGDELCQPGEALEPGQIWDVNSALLRAELTHPWIEIRAIHLCGDDKNAMMKEMKSLAEQADLVITTGGVSVGEEDHARPALQAIGGTLIFSGVAIKPGKPVSFGHLGKAYWLGLPGNPLSAFTTFELFGKALLRALSGQSTKMTPRRLAVLDVALTRKAGRSELRQARILGFDQQGREVLGFPDALHSGRIGKLPGADGFMILPADVDELPEGALVEFLPFDPGP